MALGVYYFVSFKRRSAKCDYMAELRFRQSGMSYWQESAVTLTDFILRGEVGSWLQSNDAVSETVMGMRTKIMGYHLFLIVVEFSYEKEFHGDWRPGRLPSCWAQKRARLKSGSPHRIYGMERFLSHGQYRVQACHYHLSIVVENARSDLLSKWSLEASRSACNSIARGPLTVH